MKPYYSISIPKPCHEDWSKMSSNEKGRFCKSCCKTVVDFTNMNTTEIQDYIHNNRNQRICGHIKQSQLETINLKIPETVFYQNLSFHRLFILALIFSMGITLFNCEDEKGKTKKIESIEIIESPQKSLDSITNDTNSKKVSLDSTINKKAKLTKNKVKKKQIIDSLMIVETGGIEVTSVNNNDIDSLGIEEPSHCSTKTKDIIKVPEITGEVAIPNRDDVFIGFINIDYSPEFTDTPKNLSKTEKKDYFSKRLSDFVKDNFKINQGYLNISGKQKILTRFEIDQYGEVNNIKIHASHPIFKKEAKRVLNLLPKFKPARQRDKNVSVTYTLPITFVIED